MNEFKITGIYKLRHRKNKSRIYLTSVQDDTDEYFDVSNSFIEHYDVTIGRVLNEVDYRTIMKEMALDKAIYFIAYQDRTEQEVRRKLLSSGYKHELIDEVVDILKNDGYIDDARYASIFIENRIKKYGIKKLRYDMRKRGISSHIIEEALSHADIDERFDFALQIAQKKLKELEMSTIDSYKKKQRIYSLLARRGYSYDIISQVLDTIM